MMTKPNVPGGATVVVCDGARARVLRNTGSARRPALAIEQTDWHDRDEAAFSIVLAKHLHRLVRRGDLQQLLVVAPPRNLGHLRQGMHKDVAGKIVAEIPKDLTGHSVEQIERFLADDKP